MSSLPILWLALFAAAAFGDVPAPAGKAAIIPIHGEITDVMVESVKRRIEAARKEEAVTIIFDLDTPGGLVTSSIAIADQIKNLNDVKPEIKTVAWVNPNAHSGGTIVAVACDEIVMARSSRMGDSQVIIGGPTGFTAVPEDLQPKAYTPVLTEFRASARLNGYNQVLCEAFVIPDREVWWLEHKTTGEREFVFREEKIKRMGDTPHPAKTKKSADDAPESKDKNSSAKETRPSEAATPPPDPAASEWKLVERYYDAVQGIEVDTIQPIERDDQLLEMSAGEAQAYGFSKGIVSSEADLRARYGLSGIVLLPPSWSESLAYWLTSIYVRGFLLLIILLGTYVEFHTPGTALPGLVALICLAIFVGAPYLTGLANVWEILLIIAGFLLIALEVFVVPGFGVVGISGLVVLIVGLLATFVPEEPGRSFPLYLPSLPPTVHALKVATVTLVSSLAASLVGMFILSRYLPRMPVFNRIIPANPTPSEVLAEDPYRGVGRVGDMGLAEGPLRPAGKARFGSMLVDVVTQGEYLEARAVIEVIERRGNRVVVRAVIPPPSRRIDEG